MPSSVMLKTRMRRTSISDVRGSEKYAGHYLPVSVIQMTFSSLAFSMLFRGLHSYTGRFDQLTALPGAMSASVVTIITSLCSGVLAARSMPWLSRPRIFRGARLATMIRFLPTSDSGS